MKWPSELVFIRHGESDFNALKKKKEQNKEYLEFKALFNKEFGAIDFSKSGLYPENWASQELKRMARRVWLLFRLGVSDYDTSLNNEGFRQAEETGRGLSNMLDLKIPDIIYVSPYLRTRQTLQGIIKGFPELNKAKIVSDERLREQEHGFSIIYNDWRLFFSLNPEQGLLYKIDGDYAYCFPNGESKPMGKG